MGKAVAPAVRATLIGLLVVAGLAGCAVLGEHYEEPELTLIDIQPAESTKLEQRFVLRFRLLNPNPTGLPVRGVRYRVDLLGETFASGATSEAFDIEGFGETEFEVTVGVSLANVVRVAVAAFGSSGDQVAYRLDARIATTIPFFGDVRVVREGIVSGDALCPGCKAKG